jgi:hypothetical protein
MLMDQLSVVEREACARLGVDPKAYVAHRHQLSVARSTGMEPDPVPLTADELTMCAKAGVTPKQFARTKTDLMMEVVAAASVPVISDEAMAARTGVDAGAMGETRRSLGDAAPMRPRTAVGMHSAGSAPGDRYSIETGPTFPLRR